MKIFQVINNKKEYLDLLLLADEQENMIDKYIKRGDMFVLDDNGIKAECVIVKESDEIYELKNIAVYPEFQGKGYARALIDFLFENYLDCKSMLVGTGDSDMTIPFYEKCGFKKSYIIKDFFIDNYDHPIFENGKQLVDMIYLVKHK